MTLAGPSEGTSTRRTALIAACLFAATSVVASLTTQLCPRRFQLEFLCTHLSIRLPDCCWELSIPHLTSAVLGAGPKHQQPEAEWYVRSPQLLSTCIVTTRGGLCPSASVTCSLKTEVPEATGTQPPRSWRPGSPPQRAQHSASLSCPRYGLMMLLELVLTSRSDNSILAFALYNRSWHRRSRA